MGKGAFAIPRRCYLERDITEIHTDYMKQFWSTYDGKRKLFQAKLIGAHNVYGETARFIDKELFEFLVWFKS